MRLKWQHFSIIGGNSILNVKGGKPVGPGKKLVPSIGQMTIPSVLPSKKEGMEEKLQRRVKKASGRKRLIKYSQKMTLAF